MKKTCLIYAVIGLTTLGVYPMYAAPKTVVKEVATNLPDIWQKVPANKRLTYVRAAEVDALRILTERVVGITLNGETTVGELAAADDSIRGELQAALRGVKTTEGPTYYEDGRVEVVREVKIESLIESIIKRNGVSSSVTHSKQVDTVDALGNSAIPGSLGQERILAKRAAEMDVYRRLAERAVGVHVQGNTTIKDYVVQDDALKAYFTHTIKSAEITSIAYNSDGTASVEATLKIGPLIRTIVKHKSAKGDIIKVEESVEQLSITETGNGAATKGEDASSTTVTQEVDTIVSDTLGSVTTL